MAEGRPGDWGGDQGSNLGPRFGKRTKKKKRCPPLPSFLATAVMTLDPQLGPDSVEQLDTCFNPKQVLECLDEQIS